MRRKQSGQNGGSGWIEEDELKHCVFITTDKSKDSRGGGKRCRCYDRRLYSIGLAESTTGRAKVWLRKKTMDLCACESDDHEHGVGTCVNTTLMSYTIVNRSPRICCRQGKGLVAGKNCGPMCICLFIMKH